ncbi:MAG TPA: hypothetical protein VMC42_04910 [Methanoregulaceae archaeon]|nr:hypothetical protein [Methanoregulaceae archaeon]
MAAGVLEDRRPGARWQKEIAIAIPVISFAGIAMGIFLEYMGLIPDAGQFWYGPAAGAFLLGYLAVLKPRRDIVSLFAPVYAILILIIPTDAKPNLVLLVLFAISITVLDIRLDRRFSTAVQKKEIDPMEQYLYDYMERLRPMYGSIDRRSAHEIASAFLSFKYGLYGNAVTQASQAIEQLKSGEPLDVLKKALTLLKQRAANLENADVSPVTEIEFSNAEQSYTAIHVPPEANEDPATLTLDNALILIYAVSLLTSEDDEQALEEHQNFIVGLLTSYKRAMGL